MLIQRKIANLRFYPRRALFCLALALVATSLLACGSRTVSQEKIQEQRREAFKAQERAEAEQLAAHESEWRGRTVGLEEPFELHGGDEVKLESADWKLALLKTAWTEMQTPRGSERSGRARIMVTVGEETKEVQIEEGESKLVLGFRVEVTHAHETYDAPKATYRPLAKFVIRRQ